jgi:hypothetical protein
MSPMLIVNCQISNYGQQQMHILAKEYYATKVLCPELYVNKISKLTRNFHKLYNNLSKNLNIKGFSFKILKAPSKERTEDFNRLSQ